MHRENNFDAVRLLAAAVVIFGHAHPLAATASPSLLDNSVQALAVKIFFVISGYLIYTSWSLDSNLIRYLQKRALRIFPALMIICLFTIFVIGPTFTILPFSQYFLTAHTYSYLQNIFLYPIYDLPGVFGKNAYPIAVNGSLWSLPVEFAMYLILPIAYCIDRQLKTRKCFLITTIVVCMFSLRFVRMEPPYPHPVAYGTDLISALDVCPYFLLGALYRHMDWERLLDPVFALFLVAGIALIQPPGHIAQEAILYIILPYSVLALAQSTQRILRQAGRYGDFSYGLYLYGFLVQQSVNSITQNQLSAIQNALVSLPIALFLAVLSWYLVEKPMLSRKPKAALQISKTMSLENPRG